MCILKALARIALLLFLVAFCFLPASARTKKGDAYMKQGHAAEIRKEYEQALAQYELAVNEDPADAGYQMAAKRVRFQAGQARVELGLHLRAAGKLSEALAEFQKAYAIDPASLIASQEIKRTKEMIDRENNKQTRVERKGHDSRRGSRAPGRGARCPHAVDSRLEAAHPPNQHSQDEQSAG